MYGDRAAKTIGYKKRISWLSGTYLRHTLDVPGSDVDRTVFLRDLLTFFWPGDERFIFDWTALTAIFYCTTDAVTLLRNLDLIALTAISY